MPGFCITILAQRSEKVNAWFSPGSNTRMHSFISIWAEASPGGGKGVPPNDENVGVQETQICNKINTLEDSIEIAIATAIIYLE